MNKFYKRALLLALVSLLCFVFVACGEEPATNKDTYKVLLSRDTGVTVEGDNPVIVKKGESASFKVKIQNGYTFDKIVGPATYDPATGIVTFENVTKNTNVDFYTLSNVSHTVTLQLGEGISIDGESVVTVFDGENASFKLVLDEGYVVESISGGSYDEESGVLTVEKVTEDLVISVTAGLSEYDSSVKYRYIFKGGSTDTTSVSPGSSVAEGTLVTVYAGDKTRIFLGWSFGANVNNGGAIVSATRSFSFRLSEEFAKSGTITLYPNYIESDVYYYNANGGQINPSSTNITYGDYYTATVDGSLVKVKLSENYLDFIECASTFWEDGSFYKEGHILIEYNTKPDGTGTAYSLGSKFPLTAEEGYPTLYCIWAEETPASAFVYGDVKFPYAKNVNATRAPHWVTDDSIIITSYTGNESTVVIPEKIGDKYVTAIAADAFVNKDVKTLVMGKRILKIEDGAFKGCSKLETFYFPDSIFALSDAIFDASTYESFKNLNVNATMAPRFSASADGAFSVKLSRVLAPDDKSRIIVIAGSSAYQGLASEYMENLFLEEYRVVNFGTTRTTNGIMYLEAMQYYAHEGDYVLFAPENSAYMMGETELYWKTLRDLESMYNIYRGVDISNYSGYFSAFAYFNKNYRYNRDPRAYEEITKVTATNKYGDYNHSKRAQYCVESNYIDTYFITMNNRFKSRFDLDWNNKDAQTANKDYTDPNNKTWCSVDDPYYKDQMNRVINLVKATGAEVYFSFCPVDGSKLFPEAKSLSWLQNYDKFIDDTYDFDGRVGSCVDYIFDHKYFYDCAFHPNDYGRAYRTYRLYYDLCDIMGKSPLGYLDVGDDFYGCCFEDDPSGYPETPWYPED